MIDRELDLAVTRLAPGSMGFYWAAEIEPGEYLRDVPRLVVPAIVALLEKLEEAETPETPWSRIQNDSPAATLVPVLALRSGLIRLGKATYMDGSNVLFARRVNLN